MIIDKVTINLNVFILFIKTLNLLYFKKRFCCHSILGKKNKKKKRNAHIPSNQKTLKAMSTRAQCPAFVLDQAIIIYFI